MQDWIENLLRQKIVALDNEVRRPYEWAGDAYRALAFGELFWPNVHIVRGVAFLALGDNAAAPEIEAALEAASEAGDLVLDSEITARCQFEVPDFFAEAEDPLDPDIEVAYQQLALILQKTWRSRLEQALPGASFQLSIQEGSETLGVLIAIRQSRP